MRMLKDASMMVVCITPGLFDSEWVRFELDVAEQRGIPIVGVSIEAGVTFHSALVYRKCRLTSRSTGRAMKPRAGWLVAFRP